MENNVPQELIRDYQSKVNISSNSLRNESVRNSGTNIETNTETPDTPKRDCKKILFNEPEVYPIIPLITSDEFSKIPKYIIGRQTLATVNNLLDSINQILKAKYTFLSLGKAHARKQGDLNLYLHYKKQDLDICTTNGKISEASSTCKTIQTSFAVFQNTSTSSPEKITRSKRTRS